MNVVLRKRVTQVQSEGLVGNVIRFITNEKRRKIRLFADLASMTIMAAVMGGSGTTDSRINEDPAADTLPISLLLKTGDCFEVVVVFLNGCMQMRYRSVQFRGRGTVGKASAVCTDEL